MTAEALAAQYAKTDVLGNIGAIELLKKIHALDPDKREILHLRIFGGLTFREIGDVLGHTENWARVMYYRGKETLKKELESDGTEAELWDRSRPAALLCRGIDKRGHKQRRTSASGILPKLPPGIGGYAGAGTGKRRCGNRLFKDGTPPYQLKIALSVLGAAAAIALLICIWIFAIGRPTPAYMLDYTFEVDGTSVKLSGASLERYKRYTFSTIRERDGVLDVTVRFAPSRNDGADLFTKTYEAEGPIEEIRIGGQVVWEDQVTISELASLLFNVKKTMWAI